MGSKYQNAGPDMRGLRIIYAALIAGPTMFAAIVAFLRTLSDE